MRFERHHIEQGGGAVFGDAAGDIQIARGDGEGDDFEGRHHLSIDHRGERRQRGQSDGFVDPVESLQMIARIGEQAGRPGE